MGKKAVWLPEVDEMVIRMWGEKTPAQIAEAINEHLTSLHRNLGHHWWIGTGYAGRGVIFAARRLGLIDDACLSDELKKTKRKWLSMRIKKQVLKRDQMRCQNCGSISGGLEIHHIRPVVRGGTDDIDNLVTLCKKCHKREGINWKPGTTTRYVPPPISP
jgi:hypothetical protein